MNKKSLTKTVAWLLTIVLLAGAAPHAAMATSGETGTNAVNTEETNTEETNTEETNTQETNTEETNTEETNSQETQTAPATAAPGAEFGTMNGEDEIIWNAYVQVDGPIEEGGGTFAAYKADPDSPAPAERIELDGSGPFVIRMADGAGGCLDVPDNAELTIEGGNAAKPVILAKDIGISFELGANAQVVWDAHAEYDWDLVINRQEKALAARGSFTIRGSMKLVPSVFVSSSIAAIIRAQSVNLTMEDAVLSSDISQELKEKIEKQEEEQPNTTFGGILIVDGTLTLKPESQINIYDKNQNSMRNAAIMGSNTTVTISGSKLNGTIRLAGGSPMPKLEVLDKSSVNVAGSSAITLTGGTTLHADFFPGVTIPNPVYMSVTVEDSTLSGPTCIDIGEDPINCTIDLIDATLKREEAEQSVAGIIDGGRGTTINIRGKSSIDMKTNNPNASAVGIWGARAEDGNGQINMSGGKISVSAPMGAGILAAASNTSVNISGGEISVEQGGYGIATVDLQSALPPANEMNPAVLFRNNAAVTIGGNARVESTGSNETIETHFGFPSGNAILSVGAVNVSSTATVMADVGEAIVSANGPITVGENATVFAHGAEVRGKDNVIAALKDITPSKFSSFSELNCTISGNAMAIAWDSSDYYPDEEVPYTPGTNADISHEAATTPPERDSRAVWGRVGEETGIRYYSGPQEAGAGAPNSGFIPLGVNMGETQVPTGEITLQGLGDVPHTYDNKLPASAGFALALQESAEISISGKDSQNRDLLEVGSIGYLMSDVILTGTQLTSAVWTPYSGGLITLPAPDKGYLYAKLTDEAGEESYIGTDGFVVYPAAEAEPPEFLFHRGSNEDVEVGIDLKDNDFDKIMLGDDPLTRNTDYKWDQDSGTLTLRAAYLNTLGPGAHVLKLWYVPLGESFVVGAGGDAGDEPVLDISVTVVEIFYVDGVEVTEPTVSRIQDAINDALEAAWADKNKSTVTVSGQYSAAKERLTIYIPDEIKLVWEADYSGELNWPAGPFISLQEHSTQGSGVMVIRGGGSIANNLEGTYTGSAPSIAVRDNVKLSVEKASDEIAITNISAYGQTVNLNNNA